MSRQLSENAERWEQISFSDGMVKNAPHENIPERAVAELVNAHAYGTEIQPRLASWLWADLQPPAWREDCGEALDNLILSKNLDIVTANDPIFSQAFVSRYIAWPEDDGYYHDEIIEYISTFMVRTSSSGARSLTKGCYIHGRINVNNWHKRLHKKVWQIGKRVYTSPLSYSRYDEHICVSRRTPSNVISSWDEMDDYGVVGNSNGLFKWDFGSGLIWRMNGPVPDILLDGRSRRKNHTCRYDYLISMSRISGSGVRDRRTDAIVQQSGTTKLNIDVFPNRDYSTYWTEKPIGDGTALTGYKLTCGIISEANRDPGYYRTIPAPGASFTFTHNDYTAEILVDMSTTGYNVQSMNDVLDAILASINVAFPWVKGKYDDEGFFEFNTGEELQASLGFMGPGTSGTDISSILKGTEGDGASIDSEWSVYGSNRIGACYIPVDQGRVEWHWTHYTVWRSTNISENGADPRTTDDGIDLPPLKFTWVGDYRTAAAFYASMDDGVITALLGTFEKADEGTPYKFENGNVYTISEYISERKVRVGSEYYGGANEPLQAGVIGGGRVLRASQNGDIVTLETVYNNDVFSLAECDVRKTLFWSTGDESVIIEHLSGYRVRVNNSATRSTQGVSIDPVCRVINDIVDDESLRVRMDEKHIGLLNMRLKEPMHNGNVVSAIPGFLLSAKRGESVIKYCDLPNNLKYTAGYHLATRQIIDDIQGAIQFIRKSPNYFLVWCSDSLWGGPTNNPDIKELPEFGEWYGTLHADIINEYIGAVDWGSIVEIKSGMFELACQDRSVRQLINRQYSDDLTYHNEEHDIVATDFEKCWNLSASAFGRILGHVFWLTLK